MKRISALLLAAAIAAPACSSDGTGDDGTGSGDGSGSQTTGDEWDQALEEREVDYGQALRSAGLPE